MRTMKITLEVQVYPFKYSYTINRIYSRSPMQTEKSQPEGKRMMPQTMFIEFPASSVYPRAVISRSASETDV